MKKILAIVLGLFLVGAIFVIAEEESTKAGGIPAKLNTIIGQLQEILDDGVNAKVEGVDDMPKRGTIFVHRLNQYHISGDQYVTLPNGQCSISISTTREPEDVRVEEAKSTTEIRDGFDGKDGILNIDDEYFMAKLSIEEPRTHPYLYLAYNCV
ncbi:MAG: hypothetical protein ABIB47_01255 [Candidatus Woesearchaeota archaeon]